MSRPMTATQIVEQLRKWGVTFKSVDGWQTRNRNHKGPFDDVRGFVVHHTGDDALDSIDLKVIINGRSDLPGPLAQFGCDDAGVIWLIGCGRANHAGGGDPDVLRAVTNESYTDRPPATHEHEGSSGAVDGNSHFYGVETFYSGSRPPTSKAYTSLVRLAAAICDFHGWSAKSVIGHKEWSDWKIDPGNVSMIEFRADVQRVLEAGPLPVEADDDADETVQSRVRRARAQLADVIKLLTAAVESGRTGVVQDVRDELIKQRRKLPEQ